MLDLVASTSVSCPKDENPPKESCPLPARNPLNYFTTIFHGLTSLKLSKKFLGMSTSWLSPGGWQNSPNFRNYLDNRHQWAQGSEAPCYTALFTLSPDFTFTSIEKEALPLGITTHNVVPGLQRNSGYWFLEREKSPTLKKVRLQPSSLRICPSGSSPHSLPAHSLGLPWSDSSSF